MIWPRTALSFAGPWISDSSTGVHSPIKFYVKTEKNNLMHKTVVHTLWTLVISAEKIETSVKSFQSKLNLKIQKRGHLKVNMVDKMKAFDTSLCRDQHSNNKKKQNF